jgi:predicted  nucleic acid-binding Zn-ribbon protein
MSESPAETVQHRSQNCEEMSYIREHFLHCNVGILPVKGQVCPTRTMKINTKEYNGINKHTGLPVQGSRLLELIRCIYCETSP